MEEVTELMIMEQLVENMPPELELCVSERKLKTVKETGKIVDDLCSGSKGDSAGDEVSQMWSKRSSCWELSNCREQCYSGVWKTRINGSADHGLHSESGLEFSPLLVAFNCSLPRLSTLGVKNNRCIHLSHRS